MTSSFFSCRKKTERWPKHMRQWVFSFVFLVSQMTGLNAHGFAPISGLTELPRSSRDDFGGTSLPCVFLRTRHSVYFFDTQGHQLSSWGLSVRGREGKTVMFPSEGGRKKTLHVQPLPCNSCVRSRLKHDHKRTALTHKRETLPRNCASQNLTARRASAAIPP